MYWHKKGKMCLPKKEYVNGTDEISINIVAKSRVHIHITVELKAYWFSGSL